MCFVGAMFFIDVRLCTLSIVIVFIALAFALNKMLKSYTLEIFMLCDNFVLIVYSEKNGVKERCALIFQCQGK